MSSSSVPNNIRVHTSFTINANAPLPPDMTHDTIPVTSRSAAGSFARTRLDCEYALLELGAQESDKLADSGTALRLVSREREPSSAELLRAAAHDNLLPCAALGALNDYRCALDITALRPYKKKRKRRHDEEPSGDDLEEMAAADDAELAAPNNEYENDDNEENNEEVPSDEENDEEVPSNEEDPFYALDRAHLVPAFDRIVTLEPQTHTYSLGGIVVKNASTTGLIKSYFSEFNTKSAVEAMVAGEPWRNRTREHFNEAMEAVAEAWAVAPESATVAPQVTTRFMEWLAGTRTRDSLEELGTLNAEYKSVLRVHDETLIQFFGDLWEANRNDASSRGTVMHDTIEAFYRGTRSRAQLEASAIADRPELAHFLAFHDKYIVGAENNPNDATTWNYEPFRMELLCYDPELRLGGAIDGVFRNRKTGALRDWDWKRSKEIKRVGYKGARGRGILAHLPDANLTHYNIQQNMYARYVREFAAPLHFGDGMGLAVFHPSKPSYEIYEVKPMPEEIAAIVAERRRVIAERPQTRVERAYSERLATQPQFTALPLAERHQHIGEEFSTLDQSLVAEALCHVDACMRPSVRHLTERCLCRHFNV